MGKSVSHAISSVQHSALGNVVTKIGHVAGNAVRAVPVIGAPIAKAARYSAYAGADIFTGGMAPGAAATVGGASGNEARNLHRASNIGAGVLGAVTGADLASGAYSAYGAGQAAAAQSLADSSLGTGSILDASGVAISPTAATVAASTASAATAASGAGGGGFLAGLEGAAGGALGKVGAGLFGASKGSGGGISASLASGYNYLASHGGLFGLGAGAISKYGHQLGQGVAGGGSAIQTAAQDIAKPFIGQSGVSGLSLKSLENLLGVGGGSSVQAALASSGQQAADAATAAAQAADQAAQAAGQQPIQAGFSTSSPMMMILAVGVLLGMAGYIFGKKR